MADWNVVGMKLMMRAMHPIKCHKSRTPPTFCVELCGEMNASHNNIMGERVGEEKRVGLGFSKEWLKFGYFGGKHLLFMEELVQVQIVCASFTSYILRTYARRRARSRLGTRTRTQRNPNPSPTCFPIRR